MSHRIRPPGAGETTTACLGPDEIRNFGGSANEETLTYPFDAVRLGAAKAPTSTATSLASIRAITDTVEPKGPVDQLAEMSMAAATGPVGGGAKAATGKAISIGIATKVGDKIVDPVLRTMVKKAVRDIDAATAKGG